MSQQQQRKTFGYVTLWAKENGNLIASGSVSFKKEALQELFDYLENQEDKKGYVSLDLALFSADENQVGDYRGSLKEVYVKPEGSKAPRARRSL